MLCLFPPRTDATDLYYKITNTAASQAVHCIHSNTEARQSREPACCCWVPISRWHLCHTAGSFCPLYHLTKTDNQFKENRKIPGYWLIAFQATATDIFANLLKIKVGEEKKKKQRKTLFLKDSLRSQAVCLQELQPLVWLLNVDICKLIKYVENPC